MGSVKLNKPDILGTQVLGKLPNPHMHWFNANLEARKIEEAERLALVAKTHDRFAGED